MRLCLEVAACSVMIIRVVYCVCWWHLISHHNPREGAECLIPNCNADNAYHKNIALRV